MTRVALLGALCLLLAGCGDDGGDGDGDSGGGSTSIATGPITGKVGGMSFAAADAQVDSFLSEGEDDFFIEVSATALASCNDFGSGNGLILNVPKKVGTFAMSLSLNGTFTIENLETGGDNLIATKGSIRVDEITTALVRGGVSMTYNADNSVSGEFEAEICP